MAGWCKCGRKECPLAMVSMQNRIHKKKPKKKRKYVDKKREINQYE
ncbi:MAG: hypothetical protein QME51_04330 [Planctomycetota bacterium]|nr:hypothetical protein [Planctomycetota bacterium]